MKPSPIPVWLFFCRYCGKMYSKGDDNVFSLFFYQYRKERKLVSRYRIRLLEILTIPVMFISAILNIIFMITTNAIGVFVCFPMLIALTIITALLSRKTRTLAEYRLDRNKSSVEKLKQEYEAETNPLKKKRNSRNGRI